VTERLQFGSDPLPEDHLPAVVMFDINGRDVERTRVFYSTVFGWTISTPGDAPVRLATVEAGAGGIDGVIGQAPSPGDPDAGERHSGLTVYVKVHDVAKTLQSAIDNGATGIWGPTEVAPGFWLAQFEDPDGVRIGLST
jgi:predicted enzyme related to lactoylglutathione lyase